VSNSDEKYEASVAPLMEQLAEYRRKEAFVEKAVEAVNLAFERPLRHGLEFVTSAETTDPEVVNTPVGGGRFRNMSRPQMMHAALEYERKPLVAREILEILEADGAAPVGQAPLQKVQIALKRRQDADGDILHIGDGLWGLVSWYTDTEVQRFKEMAGGTAARDKKAHAQRMSAGIKKMQARGAHYGRAPTITPKMWQHAIDMIDAGETKLSVVHRELVKLQPKNQKPMSPQTLRLRKDKLFAREPYPATWKAYYDNHKPKIEEKEVEGPAIRVVK